MGHDSDDEGAEPLSDERRVDQRHLACFAAEVAAADRPHSALVRDLSVSGALLLTRAKLQPGDRVELALFFEEGAPPRRVAGQVVRRERAHGEGENPWAKAVAVHFDASQPDLEAEARAIAERQAALRGKKPSRS